MQHLEGSGFLAAFGGIGIPTQVHCLNFCPLSLSLSLFFFFFFPESTFIFYSHELLLLTMIASLLNGNLLRALWEQDMEVVQSHRIQTLHPNVLDMANARRKLLKRTKRKKDEIFLHYSLMDLLFPNDRDSFFFHINQTYVTFMCRLVTANPAFSNQLRFSSLQKNHQTLSLRLVYLACLETHCW